MIEIKLTCETVAEAQAEMAALLDGRPRISTSGSGLKDMPLPATDMCKTPSTGAAVQTSPTQPQADSAEQPMAQPAQPHTPVTNISGTSEPVSEQPKRGRGRPRTAEPTSDAASSTPSDVASSTSSEIAIVADAEPLVTDADLQRFCAKVAEKFGGPTKLFDACKPLLAEGDVPRPTNIKDNGDRWLFIRQMEAESGVTFHG